jgi:uncharacterized protein (DUF58 family)
MTLNAATLAKLERLALTSRRRLTGMFVGDHRSLRHGSSLDFADHRSYVAGDDIRRIDHHLFARLDQLMIRLYEAEDDITVRLVIDTSASMGYHGKLLRATELAAAVGYVSLLHRDTVVVHTIGVRRPPARFCGRSSAPALMTHLDQLVSMASGPTPLTQLASALDAQRRSITVVFSDLLTDEWTVALSRLGARGSEIAIVHVLAPHDIDRAHHDDLIGDVDLVDAESGRVTSVSLSPTVVADHRARIDAWMTAVAQHARQHRASYLLVSSDSSLDSVLFGDLVRSGVMVQ